MRFFLSLAVKVVAVIFGVWLGYVAGVAISYYSVDYGDVGSAAAMIIWVPIGILACSIGAYRVADFVLRRFAVRP